MSKVQQQESVTPDKLPTSKCVAIRVPIEVYEMLEERAREDDRTISKMALIAISSFLRNDKKKAVSKGGFTD